MILVDSVRRHPSGEWCHMVSDESVGELHEDRAPAQGVPERLTPALRSAPIDATLAVSMGAEEVGMWDLVRRAVR